MRENFINFTNHISSAWSQKQTDEAEKYGKIIDLPFPAVDPDADHSLVQELAQAYLDKIMRLDPCVVLCQGEFSLSFIIVNLLKEKHIPALCACSKREVKEYIDPNGNTRKEASFSFVRFRSYY